MMLVFDQVENAKGWRNELFWMMVQTFRATRPPFAWRPKHPAVKQWKKDCMKMAEAIESRVSNFDKEIFLMECGISTPQPGDRPALDRHLTLAEMEALGVAGKWGYERD
jgi:hypothetical protein